MARKLARVAAMQLIYEQMEGGDGGEETLRGLIGFGAENAPEEEAEETEETEETEGTQPQPGGDPAAQTADAPADEQEEAFIMARVRGVMAHAAELDSAISSYLRNWSLDRVARVDLAILRLSFYELTMLKDTPESIVINEAVDMAKRYSTDKSGAFVNGVLGALVRGEKDAQP